MIISFKAEDGYVYRNKENGIIFSELILGKNDRIDNYELVLKSDVYP
jgi:hypothetical protein